MIPLTASMRWKNILASTRDAGWALFAPVVILGGIYGGIFTPTEAAGIACIYADPGRPLHLQRDVVDRAVADRDRLRQGDLADPDHRVGGRRLFMADHDERLSD